MKTLYALILVSLLLHYIWREQIGRLLTENGFYDI